MANVVSVKDYLAGYMPAYDAVKASGRERGIKAYENLFAVADRTNDMQEAQLIIEKEGLMLKLTTEDAIAIHEETLAKMDPLDELTNVLASLSLDMYQNALSTEDITYQSQLLDMKTVELTAKGKMKLNLAANLAYYLIKYDEAKRYIREWHDDNIAKGALVSMAKMRETVKLILSIACKELDCIWQELFEDQYFMINTLCAKTEDEIGRIKHTMHPDAILAYKDLISEIISEDSLVEILLKEQEHGMCYFPEKDGYVDPDKSEDNKTPSITKLFGKKSRLFG